ncbi:FOG: Transposon-encoded proteins with TYA, reverse transcriptase, integrase domains in various combinations [Plasmopara halstedii]|uniref:FOG: Transposon-encoded proteins with TYA, reverse transcriptase, integrase domains in various combinations n=1 Tax=Plasmopara halstedii TaxID=4781 RepID=A0A0P1AH74_PLAHL|nr:FOG: Transposon-encoded proteins with TYA, reverse transcriptase, integrase domains in various combinations [Plasmopara halstedii]CEG39828.1 FOG: Transposon-encoded proteins with TYA, reverse transcriptase, integrase domains in various combinations [Plasmopara halstedii]|eukprot:XP_024576197.1 FOG: Transposon-encoded proteins with TYA, reverse transcriptase, integrase domains in various combinations [Plasmopara halstedii]
MGPKSREGVFVGYDELPKAYRVYDIQAQQVVISRDVLFDESCSGDLEVDTLDDVDAANLDFGLLEIEDDDYLYTTSFTQKGKRKLWTQEHNPTCKGPGSKYCQTGLEEASA